MKGKNLKRIIVLLGSLALLIPLLFSQPASAHHDDPAGSGTPEAGTHENRPTPPDVPTGDVCTVAGGVTTSPAGTAQTASTHGHYDFLSTIITCNVTDEYNVTADGGTDGPGWPVDTNHGSTNAEAWSNSHAATDPGTHRATNCGLITIGQFTGCVKFVRVGPHVTAWGSATGFGNFYAELLFTPSGVANTYVLNGTAIKY